ncbi:hypothetical protein JCM10212_000199 [Sporobolomyces blumeae]
MPPSDYPRVPHSYRLSPSQIKRVSTSLPRPDRSPTKRSLRAAAALALAQHAGEDRYTLEVGPGQIVEGDVDRTREDGNLKLLADVERARDKGSNDDVRFEVFEGTEVDAVPAQDAPLRLTSSTPGSTSSTLSLDYDASILSDLEATWFLSHVAAALSSLEAAEDNPTKLSKVELAPTSERAIRIDLSQSPAPEDAYPPSCKTLASFFLHAATLYPDDPALHFTSGPSSPPSSDLVLSFRQLSHVSHILSHKLLSCVSPQARHDPSAFVIPLCVDKSPEMIVTMLAIALAGFGYLALEPSWPEGRKHTILGELGREGLLAGAAIVQATEGENEKWKTWTLDGSDEAILRDVLDPTEILDPVLRGDLATVETNHPLEANSDDVPEPRDDGIAYVIYTSGTTGVPKGIVVQNRNVSAFLRNYRGVFGRARGERVLQFPSYSFDVSVMNIWDTLAHGSTICITTPSALFSDLSGSILRLGCTLVDLTPTVSALLFEHPEAQPREGESAREAWTRAGFQIKQVNTGGEKVEKAVRERWRERGVRVVIDYGPTETTVGVVSNQSLEPTPSTGLPIGRPTGLTRIHILSTNSITPLPLGCIGEICVTGRQVTPGYVRKQLNEGVFFDLSDEEADLLGIESRDKEERRLYRTGDLGRWLADGEGNIECLGRKDGQVKVNGLRIEIGEIEENLSPKTNPAIVRGIVDKFETDKINPSLVAFLEIAPSYLSNSDSTSPADGDLVHPFTSTSDFASLVSTVQRDLGQKLPHYMVPRYWLAVTRIPTAGMGKADRKTLRGLAERYDFRRSGRNQENGDSSGDKARAKARTEDKFHDAARKAWARVLKLDESEIGDVDGFTELGGDSIRFMRVVNVLRGDGWNVGFRQLGEARKLTECAAVLRRAQTDDASTASKGDARKPYEPFSLVDQDRLEPLLAEITASTDFSLSRSSIVDVYPTAPSQDALLAPSFDSPKGHYFAQAVYRIQTEIASDRLESAIARMIDRHEVLRTVFVLPETLGSTAQVVLASDDEQVRRAKAVERVKILSETDWDAVVTDWLRRDRERFMFRWGQLHVSFALFSDPNGKRKLAWSLHHAMSDGWTLELLTADLRAFCYDLDLPNRPPFSSFVSWWASETEPPASTADFWRSQLSGVTPLHWPSQYPLEGDMLATTAAATLHWTGDLAGLSQRNGITPAIASRLATSIALSHHSGSKDVTLGIVRSGRDVDVDDADSMIGPCVSVLPSRLDISSSAPRSTSSLLELAKAESDADRLARVHQRVTLSDLARICSLPGRTDLFDILVTYQSLAELDDGEEHLAPWPIRQPPERIHMPTNYTLSFEFTPEKDKPDQLELACFFDSRIIEQAQVDRVLQTIARVLDYLTTAPCTTIDKLDLGEQAPKLERPQNFNDKRSGTLSQADKKRLEPLVDKLRTEWAAVLRLEESEIGAEDAFGSLGGDSIATMRLAVRLGKAGLSIPTQSLAKLPTLLQQAVWLDKTKVKDDDA